jgi:hypothetical protein
MAVERKAYTWMAEGTQIKEKETMPNIVGSFHFLRVKSTKCFPQLFLSFFIFGIKYKQNLPNSTLLNAIVPKIPLMVLLFKMIA